MTLCSPLIGCRELLRLVTSLQTLTATQQQVNINKFVSSFQDDYSCFQDGIIMTLLMNTPLYLQLSSQTGAETVFLVPVDHTESDNLHIQVAECCPDT